MEQLGVMRAPHGSLLWLLSVSCSYTMSGLEADALQCRRRQPTPQATARCITQAVEHVDPFDGRSRILSDLRVAAVQEDATATRLVLDVLDFLGWLAAEEDERNKMVAAAIIIGAVVVTAVAVAAASTPAGSSQTYTSVSCDSDSDCVTGAFCCKDKGSYTGVCAKPPLGDYTIRPAYDSYKRGTGAYRCPK